MARNPLHDVAIVGAFNTRQATVLEGVREIDLLLDLVRYARSFSITAEESRATIGVKLEAVVGPPRE